MTDEKGSQAGSGQWGVRNHGAKSTSLCTFVSPL